MFLLRCPKCNHTMKCAPRGTLSGKSKRCMYCGRSFLITNNIVKKILK